MVKRYVRWRLQWDEWRRGRKSAVDGKRDWQRHSGGSEVGVRRQVHRIGLRRPSDLGQWCR